MNNTDIAQIRSFNRSFTQRVGALDDSFLNRGRPLGECRVLFEIGQDGADVQELRDRLALDSGYLSRLLRSLERQGLVTVTARPQDRRSRTATLTKAGTAEWAEMERLSDAFAAGLLAPLSARQRSRLVTAMAEVQQLMRASLVTVAQEPAGSAAAQVCLGRYIAELSHRFDAGFDPAKSISAAVAELTPPAGAFFLAWLEGEPVGCAALKIKSDTLGEVKRMWVAPTARGLGLGRRLLAVVEDAARQQGLSLLRLETNKSLTEAQSLYRASGYEEVPAFNDEPYAHHWFQKRL